MKVEELSMTVEGAKRSNFKDKISPHLEDLLQFSLRLTTNGRDAARLVREAVAELYQSWDESLQEEICDIRLHKILTGRLFKSKSKHARPPVLISGDNTDKSFRVSYRPSHPPIAKTHRQKRLTRKGNEDVNYFKAFVKLPTAFRSAIILSYLEGFSSKEIAKLAGVQTHAIELLLSRGRELLQEELFAYLIGNGGLAITANLKGVPK
jgi:RNA polymerase sigma factor (sigma-70 family)